jgi:nitrite reductase/ring-hydroxylating ferredoxin subunit
MAWVKVKDLAELPPGSVSQIETGDGVFALYNVDGKVYCTGGTCPHAGGPLGEGNLSGDYVVCPWHGWEFDCRTGLNDSDEDMAVDTFPVRIDGGDILIDVP